MKIITLAASLRQDSCNRKLIKVAQSLLKAKKVLVDDVAFMDCDVGLYNGDTEESRGLPHNALQFIERMKGADALILSSPEYNFSVPGTLKNFIDWLSRAHPMPWAKFPIMLLAASPSLVGGNRGIMHLQATLSACAAYVFPKTFGLADAYEAFNAEGNLKNDVLQQNLAKLIDEFLVYVETLKK